MQANVERSQSLDKRLGHIDALRGIAVLGVLLVHTAMLTQQGGRSWTFGFTGQRGVQLFYMISAFTLYLSFDGERKERYPWSNYFIRRFFRIAPLFYAVIVANVVLLHLAPAFSSVVHGHERADVLMNFLFVNGASPRAIQNVVAGGWSIAVETTFYLILPLIYLRFKTIKRTLILFVATAPVLGLLSRELALRTTDLLHEQYFAFLWFPAQFPVFVLGILCYCIWRQYIRGQMNGSDRQKDISLMLLLSSVMLYCGSLPFTDLQMYFSSYLFLPLILGLSMYPWPILVNKFTRLIGKISFSLYLLHFFVLEGIAAIMGRLPHIFVSRYIVRQHLGFAVVYLILLGVSIPICMLTWKLVEQPGIRLGRRLIDFREGRRAARPLVPPLRDLESTESTPDAQF